MEIPHIAFVGAGNMAGSIIGGLLDSGHPPASLSAADPDPGSLERLAAMAPIAVYADNARAVAGANVVILAVKPQIMADVAREIAKPVQDADAVVISVAAGITVASLQHWLGAGAAVVRCMPNTPALLRCGASGLYASDRVSPAQAQYAELVLGAVGITRWVEREQLLDAITALSGSGPAYFFLFLEAMIDAACELGLDRETATGLAQQTALGSARMAIESDVDLPELRRRVTSPGGTTERALQSFEENGLRDTVARAMSAAAQRAAEMSRNMG